MKQTQHTRRFNAEAKAAVARVLQEQVSDADLAFVSISSVEVAPDKSFMRVYVSADPESYDAVLQALRRAKGFIRSCLAQELSWRIVPELDFKIDTTEDYASRIEEALKQRPPFMEDEKVQDE